MIYTALVGIVSGFALWWSVPKWYVLEQGTLSTIAQAYTSVAVTMLGFSLAMLAILISIADRRLIRNMGRTGHFKRLLTGLYFSTAYYAVTMVISLISLFLKDGAMIIGVAMATGFMLAATCCLAIIASRLWRVLNALVPQDNSPLE